MLRLIVNYPCKDSNYFVKLQTPDCKKRLFFIILSWKACAEVEFCYLCRVKLHVFNPEHDLSLAANLCRFTLPKAVAQLKRTFDFLPVIWADHDDLILVDNIDKAEARCSNLGISKNNIVGRRNATFITPEMLAADEWGARITKVDSWGADKKLRMDLLTIQPLLASVLPDDSYLEKIRNMSARFWTAENLIPKFQNTPHTTVEVRLFSDYTLLYRVLQPDCRYVVKAPWSSSGRGVRLLEPSRNPLSHDGENNVYVEIHQENWIKNIIRTQGSIMMEPYWADKVVDFGIEFDMLPDDIHYLGLSIFKAQNGIYLGSLLDTEQNKRLYLAAYTDLNLLDRLIKSIMLELKRQLAGNYIGPLGIDMMILKDGRINPMVELNLRRTMGHVALHLYSKIHRKGWMMLNVLEGRVDIID